MKQLSIMFKTYFILLTLSSYSFSQELTSFDITIDRDKIILKGNFYAVGEDGLSSTVILLQGFPGNEKDVLGIGQKLVQAGINALTFNFSGTHKSQGEFNFDNSQKDIEAAFEFIHQPENILKYKIDTAQIILGGYSYGGGMALTYAANHPEIREVFSIAGNDHGAFMREYNRNPEMKKMMDEMFEELKAQPERVRFAPGGTPKEIAEMKVIELNPTYDLKYCAPLLAPKDILLIGGWNDRNVSIENVILPLYRALKNEKAKDVKITAVQDDHSFKNSSVKIAKILIDWLKTTEKD